MSQSRARSRQSVGIALAATLALCWAVGCGEAEHSVGAISGSTMGTSYTIKIAPAPSGTQLSALAEKIQRVLERIDARMSTYREDSEVSRFSRTESTDWFGVSEETAHVVEEALRIGTLTGGALDITVAPLVELWGFGPSSAAGAPTDGEIAAALASTGANRISSRLAGGGAAALRKSNPATRIDLSSIAKGYAVDAVAALVRDAGVASFMVEIGGEVRVGGERAPGRPWKIGIETPQSGPTRQLAHAIELRDRALATSGDYRNFRVVDGKKVAHAIDPSTGRPVSHALASVTIVAQGCMEADGLATALMVLGPEKGYTLAVERGIAALFIARSDDPATPFSERATPAFEPLLSRPD